MASLGRSYYIGCCESCSFHVGILPCVDHRSLACCIEILLLRICVVWCGWMCRG